MKVKIIKNKKKTGYYSVSKDGSLITLKESVLPQLYLPHLTFTEMIKAFEDNNLTVKIEDIEDYTLKMVEIKDVIPQKLKNEQYIGVVTTNKFFMDKWIKDKGRHKYPKAKFILINHSPSLAGIELEDVEYGYHSSVIPEGSVEYAKLRIKKSCKK
jgi:hypothetical protein